MVLTPSIIQGVWLSSREYLQYLPAKNIGPCLHSTDLHVTPFIGSSGGVFTCILKSCVGVFSITSCTTLRLNNPPLNLRC